MQRCAICRQQEDPDLMTETPDGLICPTCCLTYYPEIADA